MKITKNNCPTGQGPKEWFTGTVFQTLYVTDGAGWITRRGG